MAKKKFGFDAMLEASEKKETIKEKEEQAALTIRIPASLHKELRIYAVNHGVKLREVVIDAITKHIS
jgi:hypothetical protein